MWRLMFWKGGTACLLYCLVSVEVFSSFLRWNHFGSFCYESVEGGISTGLFYKPVLNLFMHFYFLLAILVSEVTKVVVVVVVVVHQFAKSTCCIGMHICMLPQCFGVLQKQIKTLLHPLGKNPRWSSGFKHHPDDQKPRWSSGFKCHPDDQKT